LKRLLVALDGSPRAPHVLERAVQLARATGGVLVLYRAIVVVPDLPRAVLDAADAGIEEMLLRAARTDLRRLAAAAPAELIESVEADLASPWDGICRAATRLGCALIVIGSHGYGALDRILGTTAGKVVNHADRDVLVVRAG
jgi:nucleotide-binding universal stress UspA family protein